MRGSRSPALRAGCPRWLRLPGAADRRRWAATGNHIALYEHHYHPHAFGSFVLVLGRAHERVRFSWDGRECILSISFGTVSSKNASAAWTHGTDISLPNGQGLYEEIASSAAQMLAI